MKLYLLEAIGPNLEFMDGKIIALTPEVCYYLDEKGLEYNIIEDYFDDYKLFEDRIAFLEEQSIWFKNFDSFLKGEIPLLSDSNLNLATLYSIPLKTNIIDPLIYKSRVLLVLFQELKPSEVIFVKYPEVGKQDDQSLSFSDESIFSKLIPIACREKGIKVRNITGKEKEDHNLFCPSKNNAIGQLFKAIYIATSFMIVFFSRRKIGKPLNILQTNFVYNGLQTVKEILKNGHNAYVLDKDKIYSFSRFHLKITNISMKGSQQTVVSIDEWTRTFQRLEGNEILVWINAKCQLDVKDIILPKFYFFLTTICPEIVQKHAFITYFLQKESIDAIVSPILPKASELAVIAAATSLSSTKVFCIEHGDDIFRNIFFRLEELTFSDMVITTNEEHKQYLESLCKRHGLNTKVRVCQHRLLSLEPFRLQRSRQKNSEQKKSGQNQIMFVPTFFVGDALRIDCDIHLSPTAYYKFQKRILSHLATKKEYRFIWKGLLAAESIYNPIPQMISNGNISNVIFESKPFVSYLKNACRIIFDYPSTGIYESTFVGIPTMSLCDTRWRYRPQAREKFGSMLSFFSTIEEAIIKIDEFLDSSPDSYVLDCELEDVDLMRIIESEFKGN